MSGNYALARASRLRSRRNWNAYHIQVRKALGSVNAVFKDSTTSLHLSILRSNSK